MADVLLWQDDLLGPELSDHWVGGHLNESTQARALFDNGLCFVFEAGREYASMGVVTRQPIVGDFDARVRFEVRNPTQGTTFELAAIAVDPPRSTQFDQAKADKYTRSRVYDVHGVPPYVSSEFDEGDAWRIGWNRAPAQMRQQDDGSVMADNHFNRYGRGHGPSPTGPTQGWLRLVRQGRNWASHGMTAEGQAWFATGEVAEMNMPEPVFLRLAAKHWVKQKESGAPSNLVRFSAFELHVPAR